MNNIFERTVRRWGGEPSQSFRKWPEIEEGQAETLTPGFTGRVGTADYPA
jgi:hypothetical protein